MVDRVILGNLGGGQYGLRVSRPGFDVNVAEGAQLAFDSAFNAQIKVHMKVSFLGANAVSTYVSFGKTFSAPPPVIYMDKWNGTDYRMANAWGRIVDYRSDYIQGTFRLSVTNSGMEVRRDAYRPTSFIILDVEQ